MTKETRENLSAYLNDVPDEQKFWTSDGCIFKNLSELAESFKKMSKETFESHVNNSKNDFARWIYDIIGDANLANSLKDVMDKKGTEKKIKLRISSIKKKIKVKI